ncbi:MAG TPA: flagellar biosynthesis protein FlhA [Bacteroidetes bacterium]|nr:flagellar biosynthesis protein FlhA [Bacteroidota bacterium]
MAEAQSKAYLSTEQRLARHPWLERFILRSDIVLAIAAVGVVVLMIIPIPPPLLDVLIAINIMFALIVLMVAMYTERSLDFSVFPGLLLLLTLYRLGINVASTRMILGEAYAGKIIQSFGSFVVGGNYVVGIVIFLILVVINYMVITKGSSRIAEVAARFTLDAMPGKQMAVDADLNNGLIDENEARQRREDIRREADFYGAMDGAAKFVRGDAVAGIIITFINILGGLLIGLVQKDMGFHQALTTYTLLTVGDGLVSQIPALIISVSAGIIVSRAASEMNMGREFAGQLLLYPRAGYVTSGVLFFFAFVPGMPTMPFLMLAGVSAYVSYQTARSGKQYAAQALTEAAEGVKAKAAEKIEDYLYVDPMELEIGYGLIPLVDSEQEGDLLSRITMIRKQQAIQMGIVIPPIRIRDNIQLKPSEYVIKIRGNEVARGELRMGYYLALNPGTATEKIEGVATREPTYGLPALWINQQEKERAENAGYTVVEPTAVLATHLVEVIKANAHKLLTRKDVQNLIDNLKQDNPTVVEELIPNLLTVGGVHKVLQKLLKESIPIRDLGTILETLADYAPMTKDTDVLVEYVRYNLSSTITQKFQDEDGKIHALTLDPEVEQALTEAAQQSSRAGQFGVVDLPPKVINALYASLSKQVELMTAGGRQPIVVTSPTVRQAFRRLTEPVLPQLIVLSYGELLVNVQVESVGVVSLQPPQGEKAQAAGGPGGQPKEDGA